MENRVEVLMEERRTYVRRPVRAVALMKVGIAYSGRGYIKDISQGGGCLDTRAVFSVVRPQKAAFMKGMSAKVSIPSESITIHGTLIRIDPLAREAAICVTETSDDELWHRLCRGE